MSFSRSLKKWRVQIALSSQRTLTLKKNWRLWYKQLEVHEALCMQSPSKGVVHDKSPYKACSMWLIQWTHALQLILSDNFHLYSDYILPTTISTKACTCYNLCKLSWKQCLHNTYILAYMYTATSFLSWCNMLAGLCLWCSIFYWLSPLQFQQLAHQALSSRTILFSGFSTLEEKDNC